MIAMTLLRSHILEIVKRRSDRPSLVDRDVGRKLSKRVQIEYNLAITASRSPRLGEMELLVHVSPSIEFPSRLRIGISGNKQTGQKKGGTSSMYFIHATRIAAASEWCWK